MTDATVLAQKLAHLRHQVERARQKRPAELERFVESEDAQALVALAVLVAVQEATDIAFHIVGTEGWGVPASYAEGFDLLAEHGVIDRALAQQMASTVKVRNLMAHGYASLQPERLWHDLPSGLQALDQYAAAVARFFTEPDPGR